MNEITINIPTAVLIAAREVAPKKDVRFYLVGALLELDGKGNAFLVATNGHIMTAYRITDAPMVAEKIIIPRTMLDKLKASPLDVILIATRGDAGEWRLSMYTDRMTFGDDAIEARYPDWRRQFPRELSGAPAQFDVELIATLAKVERAFRRGKSRSYVTLGHNGNATAIVDFGVGNLAGLIMPMHREAPTAAPDWAIL